MLEYDFEESIGCWIWMTARLFEQAMNDELLPQGITHRQCQVLAWLAHDGDLAQNALAERMNIEPPTLVGILDRMERQGWIRRESDPEDRRRKIIRPTAKARPVWSKIVACAHHVRARAARGLDDEELETLKRLLAVVRDNLTGEDSAKAPRPKAAAGASAS